MWIKKDFHRFLQKCNISDSYRLLILNGHNSHCTFKFCHFAEKHCIIIVCLPSHTTHALQPCDVGVFSPLSSSWKSLVNCLTHDGIPVSKFNFLTHYHTTQSKAFKPSTILSAFAKCGIWLINPNAILLDAFEPAKNTTTQAALPVSDLLTPLLEIVEEAEAETILGTPTDSTTVVNTSGTPTGGTAVDNTSSTSTGSGSAMLDNALGTPTGSSSAMLDNTPGPLTGGATVNNASDALTGGTAANNEDDKTFDIFIWDTDKDIPDDPIHTSLTNTTLPTQEQPAD